MSLAELFADPRPITAAIARAMNRACWEHKCLGRPIVGHKDGKPVWIPPEENDALDPETWERERAPLILGAPLPGGGGRGKNH